MSARSLAVMGAIVVGAAFGLSQGSIDPRTNHDATMIPPLSIQVRWQDSTWLDRLADALKNATTARDSTRIEAYRRLVIIAQDSTQGVGVLECPMPVVTDSSSLAIPMVRSGPVDVNMPVIRSGCWNPLFAGVEPDSQP